MTLPLRTDDLVWYVAYGSNLSAARLDCYLSGGRPRGGSRVYVGCRDPAPPRAAAAVRLPGGLFFAGESKVWGGGIAFYNPAAAGELAARAYLLSFGQLSDVVAQETWRPVEADLVLEVLNSERHWPLESRTYSSLVHVGDRDGVPMMTITSLQELEPTAPSGPYLRTMLDGLGETFEWSLQERVDYLLQAPGITPAWTAKDLLTVGRASGQL